MKKVTLFATMILALAICASAETLIDFKSLPPTGTPQPIPQNYAGLTWNAMDYVSAELWEDAGDGFKTGPEALVAFGGGPLCYKDYGNGSDDDGVTSSHICESSIKAGIGPNALRSFRPDYMIVSEGWSGAGSQSIVVDAYNFGTKVGSQKFNLQDKAQKFKLVLPNSWGSVTELVIHPSPGGSFVLYVLGMK